MSRRSREIQRASFSRGLYALLMHAYPADFRAAHGADAADVFADLARATRARGAGPLAALWLRSVSRVISGGLEERRAIRHGLPAGRPGGGRDLDGFTREIRQALRALLRRPGFAATATLTLALGIGASTAVFSVLDTVLLRPLPFPRAEEVIRVAHVVPEMASGEWGLSEAGYFYFRRHAETLEDIGVYRRRSAVLTGEGYPERVWVTDITASVLSTVEVNPEQGRPFVAGDDTPGAAPVVLLSHDRWLNAFGGASDVVGRRIVLDGVSHEIVGVMPESFRFPSPAIDLWVPFRLDPDARPVNSHYLAGIARIRRGGAIEETQTELAGLVSRFAEEMPTAYGNRFIEQSGFRVVTRSLLEDTVGDVRTALGIVMAAAVLVLVIACANVANLTMLRSEARRREIAVRAALGASRGALLRYALAEAALLAIAGGALGVLLAGAGVRMLVQAAPAGLSRVDEIALQPRAAVAATIAVFAVTIILGLASAIRGRRGLAEQLKSGGRAASADRRRLRIRGAFVVTQVTVAVLLTAGSGLLLRSFVKLRSVDPGFNAAGVLTLQLSLATAEYDDESAMGFFEQAGDRIRSLPGVTAAGVVTGLPLTLANDNANGMIDPDGKEQTILVDTKFAGPGYFEALGMRLLDGRLFERRDMQSGSEGVVITRALAEEQWPGESAVGKQMRPLMSDYPWHTVVGVIDDVRTEDIKRAPEPTVYFPYTDMAGRRAFYLAIRVDGAPPAQLLAAVRREVAALDAGVPVSSVATMEELVANELSRTTFTLTLVGVAAAMALFLCMVGIYGVIAASVGQRRFEIGVRMALGARSRQVAGMVIGQTLALAGIGIVLGTLLAFAGMGVMQSLLFEVDAADPLTLAAVALGLTLVAALAGALPANRASKVDAIVALQRD